ncbi:hypothetical protein [Planktothrix sp. FACHB-1365]|uniref:hypothetical protein n=1 Tax=Planktothrix sp. FACHB-1365 TaxID=2692855 RepID=UPI001682A4F7|nr:hypothetical protein [Planktothrix sp. FACHB-1365]MBD2483142.1 hypothetical protein [Planktothrix sp. FACHB-1365]
MNNPCSGLKDSPVLFEPSDLRLIEQALSFHPDLEMAVYLTKLAKTRLCFPVSNIKELAIALETDNQQVCCRDRVLYWKDMKKFIKSQMFPILNEYDFLSKVYMALCIGAEYHHHERRFMELRRDCH